MKFRPRGADISRLEGFSDCVFGFAVTLLVVSLAVPTKFADLVTALSATPSFAVSFALLAWIWWSQYRYFRRYGLEDGTTVLLTLVMLFVVLVYIYPLKFLYTAVFAGTGLTPGDASRLFLIYGFGFAATMTTLALLYANAYRQREALALTAYERLETRLTLQEFVGVAGIGLLSAGLALLPGGVVWAGWSYFLIAAVYTVTGFRRRRSRRTA